MLQNKKTFRLELFSTYYPLLNPKLNYQIIGVSDEKNLETHAMFINVKTQKAWVVFNIIMDMMNSLLHQITYI